MKKTRYLMLLVVFLLSSGLVTITLAAANITSDKAAPGSIASPQTLVRMDVNYAHNWVEVETIPGSVVTVTSSGGYSVTGNADGDGWFRSYEWSWAPEQPDITIGEALTATVAGLTSAAIVNPVGGIEIFPDFSADSVSGTISAPWFAPLTLTVDCEIWVEGAPAIAVEGVDPDGGVFFCDFAAIGWDLQPNQMIAVRYNEPDGDGVINVYAPPWMRVNYGHDWVGGDYEAGHTFWITVTNNAGDMIKGTAVVDSQINGGWEGDGFGVEEQHWAAGFPPDIQPNDWVYFASDDGYRNAILVGEISGTVDINTDSVGGPVYADWFTNTLQIECHPWGAWESGLWPDAQPKNSTAHPDGSLPYLCQWDPTTEWDIEPGQDVAVMYIEPDLDRVINVFQEPAPHLRIEKWTNSDPGEGGNLVFNVQYTNEGLATAENVVITDTMLGNMVYITDTSGLPLSGSGAPGDPLVWDVGLLPPGEWIQFQVFAEVSASAGEWLTNTLEIATSNPYDQGDPSEKYVEWTGEVQPGDTHLSIGKDPWTGDPAPGYEFYWAINACNNGSTDSAEVFITDTLPLSTTLVSWKGENRGWTEVSHTNGQLVLSYPSVPAGMCSEVALKFLMNAAAQPGMTISNTAMISSSNDLEVDDNQTESWIEVNEPHTNLHLEKWWNWGQLVPGGEISYGLGIYNDGNKPVSSVLITDTLPVSTTVVGIWAYDRYWQPLDEVTPTVETPEYLVWEVGSLANGDIAYFEIQLRIDPRAVPGTVLVNAAEISRLPDEDTHDDNHAEWTETVFDHGPNLRIQKDGQWDDWGEDTRRASYWMAVENVGDESVSPVVITDTYDSKMYLALSGVETNYWQGWDWVDHGGYFTITFEALHSSERVEIFFRTITSTKPLPFGLIFTNTAEVTLDPGDTNPEDNSDQAILTTGPSLAIQKDLVDGKVLPGELVTYTLSFGNYREGYEWWWGMQGDALITDTLPAGMEYITSTLSWCEWIHQEWCGFPASVNNSVLTWHLWPLNSSEQYEIRVVVRITDTAQDGDIFVNLVEIASTKPFIDIEANYQDNLARHSSTVSYHLIYLPLVYR